jgi:hypothetical protein
MSDKNPMPATDSARDLHNLVGDDVTADFESDPKFVDSNPTAEASSENLAVLRDTDDEEDSDDELEDEDDDDLDDDDVDEDDEDLDDDEVDDDIEEDDEEQEEEEDEPDEELAARNSLKLILRQAA